MGPLTKGVGAATGESAAVFASGLTSGMSAQGKGTSGRGRQQPVSKELFAEITRGSYDDCGTDK